MNPSPALEELLEHIDTASAALPPVHQWTPARDAQMDLVIGADGRWVHEGGVIERPALVKLLASVLRREGDGRYALVTPAERVFIEVEDLPFLVVDWELHDPGPEQTLSVRTSLDETVVVDAACPLQLDAGHAAPRVAIRPGLSGRFSRACYYRLAEVLESGDRGLGIRSAGRFFALEAG